MINRLVISIVIAVSILLFFTMNIEFSRLSALMINLDWITLVSAMLAVCVYTLLVDVFSFGFIYRHYLAPSENYSNLIGLRGLTVLAVSTAPPLAPMIPIGYFRKKRRKGFKGHQCRATCNAH